MSNPQGPSHNPADPPAWGKEPAGGWGQPNPDDERTQRVDPRSFAPGGGQPPAAPPQQGWNGPSPQQYGAPPQQQPYGGQQYGGQPQYGAPQQPYPPQQGWPQQGGPQPTQQWGGQQPGYPPPPETPAKSGRSKLPLILGGIGVLVVAAVLVLGFVTPGFFVSKVFDTAAVQTGVQKILTDSYGVKDVTTVTCGQNITVTAGNTFTCDATIAGKPARIPVKITSNAGDYEVGRPA
jgi:hypothetical protein